MRTPLVITALEAALGNGAAPGCVFHSDRGSQYTSVALERFCTTRGVTQSKGRVATCWDNAVAESFFSSFKVEFYYQHTHPGGLATKAEIAQWITFYNTTRFHSALSYNSPQNEWNHRTQHPQTQAA